MPARYNITNIRELIAESGVVDDFAAQLAQEEFEREKEEMLAEFDASLVTQEILEGPKGENITGTLADAKVPGNLYAFLGFDSDKPNPIIGLRNFIDKSTYLNTTLVRAPTDLHYRFQGYTFTQEELRLATPLPWTEGETDRSWIAIVENGTSTFAYYLYKRWAQGYSKEALQAKVRHDSKQGNAGQLIIVNQGQFKRTPYVTQIINNFIISVGTSPGI